MATCSEYISCPYDKSHVVLKTRMQIHLHKSHSDTSKANKRVCHFNTTHVVDEMEFQHHLVNCPDAATVLAQKFCMNRERPIGNISLEESVSMSATLTSSEDWDEIPTVTSTYDPLINIENRNIMRIPMGLTKSQKRTFKQTERERMQLIRDNAPSTSQVQVDDDKTIETPLRLPSTKPACEFPSKQIFQKTFEDELAPLLLKKETEVTTLEDTSKSSDTEVENESNHSIYDTEDSKSDCSYSTIQTNSDTKTEVESYASSQNNLIQEFNHQMNILARAQENLEAKKQELIAQFTDSLKIASTQTFQKDLIGHPNMQVLNQTPNQSSSISEPNLATSKNHLGQSTHSLN